MSTLAKQSGVIGKMAVKKLDKKVSKVEAQKPVGAYEGMSLRQKAKAMARDGEQISINNKYLDIGLGQEKISNTLNSCLTSLLAWYPNLNKGLKKKVQTSQNKCVRFCLNMGNRDHVGMNEFKRINWLPTKERFEQCLLTSI